VGICGWSTWGRGDGTVHQLVEDTPPKIFKKTHFCSKGFEGQPPSPQHTKFGRAPTRHQQHKCLSNHHIYHSTHES
jgi:hypothetical protein